ncbi:protein phosphatase 1G [Centruroides vittatus]|uniref:protein phosphatase 1G n=1 Tax=Centruroides vittatus TaxID=120091 RepID=UPI00350FB220
MGAYLSEPVTKKVSTDYSSKRLSYGASSMQGWRVTQEDAHNCIPDYDEKTSFFAVYDGHGGAEVAKYCSLHLPEFLHSLPQYKSNIAQSLEDAFIEFDSLLTKPEVISELKQLSGSSDASDSEEDDTTVLNEEAEMPLEELLARYKSGGVPLKSSPHLEHLQNNKWRSLAYVAFPSKNVNQPTNLHNDKPKSPVHIAKQENSLKKSEHNLKEENFNEILINGESNCIKKTQEIINDSEENSEKNTESSGDDDDDASSESHNRTKDKNDSVTEHTRNEEEKLENIVDSSISNDDLDKEKDVDIDKSNKLESSFEKGSTSNNSSNNRKKGPVVDLEESDTSDDDYGESDSSEIDEEEWKEEDEEEEEGGEEEEEDDDDEEDDEIEEGDLFPIGEKEEPGSDSGCTAVVAVIHGTQLYVANAGDSRCVVSRLGEAIEMSSDHKPEDELERKRIENAGGHVTIDGRVNGGLNLSRAIGDHSYKQNKNLSPKEQMITALPDVRTLTLDVNSDDFMVLACDGIWNFMSSQEVIDFIKDRLDSDIKLSTISEQLFDYCLAPDTLGDGTGCDNMTCIIVKFHKLDSTNDNMSSLKRSHSPVNESPKEEKKMKVEEETSI